MDTIKELPEPWRASLLPAEAKLWTALQNGQEVVSFSFEARNDRVLEKLRKFRQDRKGYFDYKIAWTESFEDLAESVGLMHEKNQDIIYFSGGLGESSDEVGDTCSVRAEFLNFLLEEGFFREGLLIEGIRILNPLIWEDKSLEAGGIIFLFCHFNDGIRLSNIKADTFFIDFLYCTIDLSNAKEIEESSASISQVSLRRISFAGCEIVNTRNVALLIRGGEIEQDIELRNAQIKGSIQMEGVKASGIDFESARLECSGSVVLSLKGVELKKKGLMRGNLTFEEARVVGEIQLERLKIESIDFINTCLENAGSIALSLKKSEIRGDASFWAAQVTGSVQIEGLWGEKIIFDEVRLECAGSVALLIKSTQLRSDLTMYEAQVIGTIQLEELMTRNMSLEGVRLEHAESIALHIKKVKVAEELSFWKAQISGSIRLEDIKAKKINSGNAHFRHTGTVVLLIKNAEVLLRISMKKAWIIGGTYIESSKIGLVDFGGVRLEQRWTFALIIRKVRLRKCINLEKAQILGAVHLEELNFRFRGLGLTKIILAGARIESPELPALQIRRVQSLEPVTIENTDFSINGAWEMEDIEIKEMCPLERTEMLPSRLSIKKSTFHSSLLCGSGATDSDFWLHLEDTMLMERGMVKGAFRVEMRRCEVFGRVPAEGEGATLPVPVLVAHHVSRLSLESVKLWGDVEIELSGQEPVSLELSEVEVGRDLVIRGGAGACDRLLMDRVYVARELHLRSLTLPRGLDIVRSRVGFGLYTEGLCLGPGLDNMALRIEETRVGGYLDLTGIEELQGGLSLRGTTTHTYRDRTWQGLSALKVEGFEWWMMPDDHEKGLRRRRYRTWKALLERKEWSKLRERLRYTDSLRALQPPVEARPPSLLSRLLNRLARATGWSSPALIRIVRRWK